MAKNEDERLNTCPTLPAVEDEEEADYTPRQTHWDGMTDAEIQAYVRGESCH